MKNSKVKDALETVMAVTAGFSFWPNNMHNSHSILDFYFVPCSFNFGNKDISLLKMEINNNALNLSRMKR